MTTSQTPEKPDSSPKDRTKQTADEPLFLGHPHGYWAESRRPLASLLFILPLLVVYEVGILCLGPAAVRNGVDIWLRQFLEWLGFGQYFLLPAFTIGILLSWQYTTREPWRVSRGVLCGMTVESLLLAFCLRLILHAQGLLSQSFTSPPGGKILTVLASGGVPEAEIHVNLSSTFSNLVMFLGAGIYEELLFRLIFLTAAVWLLRRLGMNRPFSVLAAVILTSMLFSLAHYVGAQGETPQLFSFVFRFIAGVFFCVLFVFRGFGIAAGTHAAYDIVVGFF